MTRPSRHLAPRRPSLLSYLLSNPDLNQEMLAIILLVGAVLATLSFFALAGVAGQFIDALLAIIFGEIRYGLPVLFIVVAVILIKDLNYEYRAAHVPGALLFLASSAALFHLAIPLAKMSAAALQGFGGGLLGLALAWPLTRYLGFWGALVIMLGIFGLALILILNTSLRRLIAWQSQLLLVAGQMGRSLATALNRARVRRAENRRDRLSNDNNANLSKAETISDTLEMSADEPPRFARKRVLSAEENDADAPLEALNEMPNETIVIKKPAVTQRHLPALSLLTSSSSKPTAGDIKANAAIIKDTLSHFGIEVDMGEIRVGPTVTQYSLKPSKGIKLTRLTVLANDLALALAAHPIRIEAPIPGKSLVGIEVPNERVALVTLRELLEGPEFKNRAHNLMIAIGKDVAGKVWLADLPKMPHLLVAGATGSGKTVCINTIILSLLFQNTPATLRFIMIDPKRVELTLYNGIPHLLTPVITDPIKTVNAMRWLIGEMERRFDTLAAAHCRDIASYNTKAEEPMPAIVLIIDELADLMTTAAADVEAGIIRLAQMARAVGIHLIVATQRPSVEVITGLMKANIPARIAFSVASIIDSRTILDTAGADKLLGRGDMLFLTADLTKPRRLQGAFVSETEMKQVIEYLKGDEPPSYDDSIVEKNSSLSGTINMFGGPSDANDPLFDEARRLVVESGKASASLLQRRLKVGYARAARLLDELEEAGIVGPADGAKPRELFTEHLRPAAEEEIAPEEQTLDAGGVVLDDPKT